MASGSYCASAVGKGGRQYRVWPTVFRQRYSTRLMHLVSPLIPLPTHHPLIFQSS